VLIGYASLSLLAAVLMQLGNLNAALLIAVNGAAAEYVPDAVLLILTMLGEGQWEMALIAPCLLFAPRVNVAALYAAPFVLVLTHVPKLLLHLPRPSSVLADHAVHLLDAPRAMNTFPSGHAVMVATVATVLVLGCDPIRRRMWSALLVLIALSVIAWSRVAVGAHWPVDVLVGAALGVAAGYAGIKLAERFYEHSRRATLLVAAIYLLGTLVLALSRTAHPEQELLRAVLVAIGGVSAVAAIARAGITETLGRSRAKADTQARALTT
jgi:undecaprenyl-diphosphatase